MFTYRENVTICIYRYIVTDTSVYIKLFNMLTKVVKREKSNDAIQLTITTVAKVARY